MHRDASFLEKPRDDAACALLLETEFGMGVQVAAQGGQKRQIVFDPGGNAHEPGYPVMRNGRPTGARVRSFLVHQTAHKFNPQNRMI